MATNAAAWEATNVRRDMEVGPGGWGTTACDGEGARPVNAGISIRTIPVPDGNRRGRAAPPPGKPRGPSPLKVEFQSHDRRAPAGIPVAWAPGSLTRPMLRTARGASPPDRITRPRPRSTLSGLAQEIQFNVETTLNGI